MKPRESRVAGEFIPARRHMAKPAEDRVAGEFDPAGRLNTILSDK
jgi:hypothetical protein